MQLRCDRRYDAFHTRAKGVHHGRSLHHARSAHLVPQERITQKSPFCLVDKKDFFVGAGDRGRTCMLLAQEPKSCVSANSTTPACAVILYIIILKLARGKEKNSPFIFLEKISVMPVNIFLCGRFSDDCGKYSLFSGNYKAVTSCFEKIIAVFEH